MGIINRGTSPHFGHFNMKTLEQIALEAFTVAALAPRDSKGRVWHKTRQKLQALARETRRMENEIIREYLDKNRNIR